MARLALAPQRPAPERRRWSGKLLAAGAVIAALCPALRTFAAVAAPKGAAPPARAGDAPSSAAPTPGVKPPPRTKPPPKPKPVPPPETPQQAALREFLSLEAAALSASHHWVRYCKEEGDGFTNPAKHSEEFLREFLRRFEAGEFPEVELATPEMAERVIQIRKGGDKAEQWLWTQHCSKGPGTREPRRLPAEFVGSFLERLDSGALQKPQMAVEETILKYQQFMKMGEQADRKNRRTAWFVFSQENAAGMKSPSGLPEALLKEFLTQQGCL